MPVPAARAGTPGATTDVIAELEWRGLLHQTTSENLRQRLLGAPHTAYVGFDPTASSLTVGNYVPMVLLAHWQRAGHRPIVLTGGGTGLIGDPSGKSAERQLLTRDEVRANVASQRKIFERVLDLSPASGAAMVDNADWLEELGYIEVLRDVGKHFSVNQMIVRDSVASRLNEREQGISYTEFSYMILQAYDFLHLYRSHGCSVQMGGADQWGNIVSGIDLIRRCEQGDAFGITNPLVTKSDGGKFGKTEKGAIWLTADRTSPYRFHQYWLNTADADVSRFLKWFTFLGREEIELLERAASDRPQERAAQRALADHLTTIFHGETECARAEATGRALFTGDLRSLDGSQLAEAAADLAGGEWKAEDAGTLSVVDAVVRAGLAASKREARDFATQGSLAINGEKCAADRVLSGSDLLGSASGGIVFLRRGKKQWGVLRRAAPPS
ncbi:MAG: tyrosine--tRNA ligase [Planctomycetota bacterium]|nr:tyrosine--tRNA ligase [Planctomycetota bacterium]MDA1105028.1 tyrosine--tRNA ligase [Planctomycetota bacterium]